MSVQSVCGEHMSCFCIGICDESRGPARYPYQNNEYVFHRQIEHECVVVFITYYTFDAEIT